MSKHQTRSQRQASRRRHQMLLNQQYLGAYLRSLQERLDAGPLPTGFYWAPVEPPLFKNRLVRGTSPTQRDFTQNHQEGR